MHRLRISETILIMAVFSLAFTWPWEVATEEQKKSGEKSSWVSERREEKNVSVVPPVQGGEGGSSTGVRGAPKVHKIYRVPEVPKAYKVHKVHKPVPVAAKLPGTDAPILKVRNQIRDIIRLNESLKVQSRIQVREVQRITTQAKIHRQILKELEKQRAAEGENGGNAELLRKEKIELIELETRKNRKYLIRLQEGAEDD